MFVNVKETIIFKENKSPLFFRSSLAMNIILIICIFTAPIVLYILTTRRTRKRLPPGSLGIPFIGQSLTLLKLMKSNNAEQLLDERSKKYGPVSKLTLFGKSTVFIHGTAANKFLFTSDSSVLSSQQNKSLRVIMGDRNLLELSGEDHKRVRAAIVPFLKPESLKEYVGELEVEVRKHLEKHWHGQEIVKVLPSMKSLTFNVICSLLFGIKAENQRNEFISAFQEMIRGVWSIPVNLPFTRYRRSLLAKDKVQKLIKELVQQKRLELMRNDDEGSRTTQHDLITTLLRVRRDNTHEEGLTEDEIVHNVVLVMVAGHDTSAVLITFMMRFLSNEPSVYASVLKEQEEIAETKAPGESLTWEDINKMKYTWRVAMETLRMLPPVFGGFRTALKDIEYGGYLIPKGWLILWVSSMTHMDESLYPEPEKFDPTRFEAQNTVTPYSFIAFGGGPRICPGYEFARIETLVMIHYLVTRFTWKLCHPEDNACTRDPMPTPTEGLPVYINLKKPL